MRDIIRDLAGWARSGQEFAVATVVRTWNSAPRPVGASMALGADGEVVGSVSGGCVEGAVVEVCREVLTDGTARRVRYGVSDSSAYAVGLTCGGTIELVVTPADAQLRAAVRTLEAGLAEHTPYALVTLVESADGEVGEPANGSTLLPSCPRMLLDGASEAATGSLGEPGLDHAVAADARGLLAAGETGLLQLGRRGERRMSEVTVFVESYAPPPRMLVFGAIDFAAAVARMGKFLGYHVTVCDARPVFATARRFPDADEVVVDWPHRYFDQVVTDDRTAICVLTHDPKFDVPLLVKALRRPAGYIGAMGSRRTHEDRLEKLRGEGMTDAELARLRSPIGLDLGGRTPEETAVSIAAEIVALRWDGTGQPLTVTGTPIHRESLATLDAAR
ncbi:MAG: XdhC family protein [Austwickia sp.]|jgi:xanthine dehydrogenase accessory factor|nr:MAG: XdhC family protein [Austwickia sp.]